MSYANVVVAIDDGLHATGRVRLAAACHSVSARLVGAAPCRRDYPQRCGETAVPGGMVIEEIRQLGGIAGAGRCRLVLWSANDA